jgi:hypothetical protein
MVRAAPADVESETRNPTHVPWATLLDPSTDARLTDAVLTRRDCQVQSHEEQLRRDRRPQPGTVRAPGSDHSLAAVQHPAALTAATLRHLQRVAGNRALVTMLERRRADPAPVTVQRTWDNVDTEFNNYLGPVVGVADLEAVSDGLLKARGLSHDGPLVARAPVQLTAAAGTTEFVSQMIVSKELWFGEVSALRKNLGFVGGDGVKNTAGDAVGGAVELAAEAGTGFVSSGADFSLSGLGGLIGGVATYLFERDRRAAVAKQDKSVHAGFYDTDRSKVGQGLTKKGFLTFYVYLYGHTTPLVYPKVGYMLNAGTRSEAGTFTWADGAAGTLSWPDFDQMHRSILNEVKMSDIWNRHLTSKLLRGWR